MPPGIGLLPLAGGIRTRPCALGFTLARPAWVHPGDVHYSQDHCHSPFVHSIALQWSEQTEGTLIENNNLPTQYTCPAVYWRPTRGSTAHIPLTRWRGLSEAVGGLQEELQKRERPKGPHLNVKHSQHQSWKMLESEPFPQCHKVSPLVMP